MDILAESAALYYDLLLELTFAIDNGDVKKQTELRVKLKNNWDEFYKNK